MPKYLVRHSDGRYWCIDKRGTSHLVSEKDKAERFDTEDQARHYMRQHLGRCEVEKVEK